MQRTSAKKRSLEGAIQNGLKSNEKGIDRPLNQLLLTSLKTPKSPSTGEGDPTNTEVLRVTINSVNGGTKSIFVSANTTGLELKKIIYSDICQSLQVNQMSVKYEGSVIGNNRKLSDINIVTGKNLVLDQDKIAVAEVANIIADAEGIDPISEEKGVAKMCCGHGIGRDTMTVLIRSLISANKYQIQCPYPDENNLICSALWAFKDCKKVGVFTKEEQAEFEEGLSINWIKKFTKICPNPKCNQQIFKSGLKTNRVVCSSCKYGDFCFLCLKKWKGGNICGNEECVFLNGLLKSCPWDKIISLGTIGKVQNYKTPRYRACVHCNAVNEHKSPHKHLTCGACGVYFCWVCLQTPVKGVWPCGRYNEFCGKVAQVQNL